MLIITAPPRARLLNCCRRSGRATALLLALSVFGLAPHAAPADMQLPALRAGEWSYQRSVVSPDAPQPKISEGRRCGSPSVQVRANITALKARHCTFSAIEHDAKRYSWSSSCPVGDEVLQMRSVLTVKGDELYRVVVEAQQGHHLPVHTVTVGRWIGECHSPNLPRRRLPFVLSPQPSSPIAAPPAPTAAPAAPSSSTP